MMVTKLHEIISKYIAGDDNRNQLTSEIVKEIVQSGIWCGTCGKDLEIICDDCKKIIGKFKGAPISGHEALYDVKVPFIDLPDEAVKKAIEKPKEDWSISLWYKKEDLLSSQKPLDADIAEHINNHFEELL